MKTILFATAVGFFCGFLFSFLGVPIPAPSKLAGLMGIVGIYLGYVAYNILL